MLKENIKSLITDSKEPYLNTMRAYRESNNLAVLAGLLTLNAVDGIIGDISYTTTSRVTVGLG
jgi:hypothetical protein